MFPRRVCLYFILYTQCLSPEDVSSFDNLVQALKKWFGLHSSEKWDVLDTFTDLKQHDGEPVNEYFLRLFKFARDLQKGNDELKCKFVTGLLPHVAQFVKEYLPGTDPSCFTIEQALDLARTAYALKRPKSNDKEALAMEMELRMNDTYVDKCFHYNLGKSDDSFDIVEEKECVPKISDMVCFRCKLAGHSRKCCPNLRS